MATNRQNTPIRTKPWVPSPISTEEFGELEREYVLRVLEKRRVFRFFKSLREESEADKLEQLYRERLGVNHALAVNSGTSALISALVGAGIGPGDEVIVPAYTYIATAAAVLIARAVPVIVEVDESLTLDPVALENAITPYTKAVIPVHMRGVPADMNKIMDVASRHKLIVIEDVAQANGGSYFGRALGSIGHAGCFSFQQAKVMTAGEGGMITTNDENIFERASIYHDSALAFWKGKDERPIASFAGENYRMSEINAALALAQAEGLGDLIGKLRRAKKTILEQIRSIPSIQLQAVSDPQGDISTSVIFFLKDAEGAKRFAASLKEDGIPAGTIYNNGFADRHIYANWDYVLEKRSASEIDNPWTCASYKGNVSYSKDMCPRTLDLLGRAISIPLHQTLTEEDCQDAIAAIRKAAERI
jgi:8-amino-3,8-dideoxy-alpha-D-manno-octulosonate transaminase